LWYRIQGTTVWKDEYLMDDDGPMGPCKCNYDLKSYHYESIIFSIQINIASNTGAYRDVNVNKQQLSHLSQVFGVVFMNQKRITSDRAHRSAFSTHSYQAICLH